MALENQGEQKTKPDISFVQTAAHFNLSTTVKEIPGAWPSSFGRKTATYCAFLGNNAEPSGGVEMSS
jgi:hypothetical protein